MTSSSKDRGSTNNGRDDCQIHVDKEGESCVIKIESVGQEKMLKELLGRFNSLKTEVNQLISGQQKQQQPKEMLDAIQDITAKLKPLEDQLQKVNKHVGDDHIQLNKLNTDLNKKFDDIKQDLNTFKEQQKNLGSSKDIMEKILHKLDNLDKIVKNSQDEGQKRLSTDLQNLKQQIPSKNDHKPVLDAIQTFQSSFDKEKSKFDILARKIDAIDQKLKESQPEHMAAIKDIQTKIEPLHKATPQTSETLKKLDDRVEAMHADTSKSHPDIIEKLDNINQHLKNQPNSFIEPMKQILNDKLNPFLEQQRKDGEDKFDTINKDNTSHSPNHIPLCVNGMIPTLNKISDSYLLRTLAGDIAKKLTDIQTKLPSIDDHKRKQDDVIGNLTKQQTPLIDEIKRLTPILDKVKQQQQDLLKNIETKLNTLSQNLEKENDLKKRSDIQPNIDKEISTRTQPLQQAVENLSKQQQPFMDIIRELPKKLDSINQSQPQTDLIKEFSSKLDPLTQSIKAIKDGLDHQTQNKDRDNQILTNLDKKLNQVLADSPRKSDNNQDIEKNLQPFSNIIKTLKDNIEQSRAQDTKKFDNFEQRLAKSSDILDKLNEITTSFKQTDPTIKKLSDDVGTIKNLIEKQPTPEDLLSKINDFTQKQKAPLEATLKDIHSKVEPLHQASKDSLDIKKKNDDIYNKIDQLMEPLNKVNNQIQNINDKINQIQSQKNDDSSTKPSTDLMNTLKKLDEKLTQLNNNLPAMGDIPKQIGSVKDALDKLKQNESNNNNNEPSQIIKDINDRLKTLDETMKRLPDQIASKNKRLDDDDDNDGKMNTTNLRQNPLSQSNQKDKNHSMNPTEDQIANLFTNLLTLQTAIQNSDSIPSQDIQQYLNRIEQAPLVQIDQGLQELVQRIKDLSAKNNNNKNYDNTKINPNTQKSSPYQNPTKPNSDVQDPKSYQDPTKGSSNVRKPDSYQNSTKNNFNVRDPESYQDPTKANSNVEDFDSYHDPTKSSTNVRKPDSYQNSTKDNFDIQNPESYQDPTKANSNIEDSNPYQNSTKSNPNVRKSDSYQNPTKNNFNVRDSESYQDSTKANSNRQDPTKSNSNVQGSDSYQNPPKGSSNVRKPDSYQNSTKDKSNIQDPESYQNPTISNSNLQGTNSYQNPTKSNFNVQNSDPYQNRNKGSSNERIPDSNQNPRKNNFNIQNSDPYQNSTKDIRNPDLYQSPTKSNSNIQNSESNKNLTNRSSPLRNAMNNSPIEEQSDVDDSENRRNENKMLLSAGYLTKSRYISLLTDQTIRNNWPKLSSRSTSTVDSIVNQPLEFDNGTNLDRLIKQNSLEQYASLTRKAVEKSDKDYDKISYMMDSIVFDKMTMIGSREALIRPWDPSLLNRASSKGFYPYPSGNSPRVERFQVDKDIALWMVETDESKPYFPSEFRPNIERLNEKYERIQQPYFNEIRHKRRKDETRWNERYAFTKDNQRILFVNDLRSYFMDYDTKRKYQVHDDVPINPVCRTGIAGRGDLPFWGPNHCVVVVLLRNPNEPEVVLMRHHGGALVLPKGFYGHEALYDNQIKIIQDPISGQILPPNLFDYWWSNVMKLNENNNLKRILNDKKLKEEFAEIFSQKGCNKSVFDNGYVDHPLNTDHAWVESSVWKIQFKDWRIPEMKSAKYSIADDLKNNNTFPFLWMKLTDAILVVPSFDRGILVDVLATGMPL